MLYQVKYWELRKYFSPSSPNISLLYSISGQTGIIHHKQPTSDKIQATTFKFVQLGLLCNPIIAYYAFLVPTTFIRRKCLPSCQSEARLHQMKGLFGRVCRFRRCKRLVNHIARQRLSLTITKAGHLWSRNPKLVKFYCSASLKSGMTLSSAMLG